MNMFQQKLGMTWQTSEKDPIWVTCSVLKGICIGYGVACCPQEAWPLNPEGPSIFDWLGLQDGVHTVWKLVRQCMQRQFGVPRCSPINDSDTST